MDRSSLSDRSLSIDCVLTVCWASCQAFGEMRHERSVLLNQHHKPAGSKAGDVWMERCELGKCREPEGSEARGVLEKSQTSAGIKGRKHCLLKKQACIKKDTNCYMLKRHSDRAVRLQAGFPSPRSCSGSQLPWLLLSLIHILQGHLGLQHNASKQKEDGLESQKDAYVVQACQQLASLFTAILGLK